MSLSSKKLGLLIGLGLIGGAIVYSVLGPDRQQAKDNSQDIDLSKVVLMVGAPNKIANRPYLEVSGELKDVPYKIEWADFSATPALLEALRSGNIDVGGNGGSTGIIFETANVPGTDVKTVALGHTLPKGEEFGGAALLVRADSPFHSIKDLKGAKVSVVRGSGTQYILTQALKNEGLRPEDVNWVFLDNYVSLASLRNGAVDAWGIWDPQATELKDDPELRLISWLGNRDETYAFQFASGQSLKDPAKAAAIDDFLKRLARSTVYADRHQDEFAEAASKLLKVDKKIFLQILARSRTEYGLDEGQKKVALNAIQKEADYWLGESVIRKPVNAADVIDFRFNDGQLAATRDAKRLTQTHEGEGK